MAVLEVCDFPPELYEKLKACAEREHRSVEQQTVVAVEAYVHRGRVNNAVNPGFTCSMCGPQPDCSNGDSTRTERRRRVLERIKQMSKVEVPGDYPDDAEILRQCREERDRQLMALEGFDVDEGGDLR